jgi:hypothetical protein
MHTTNTLCRSAAASNVLRTGLYVGLAGGMAEIVVVWIYAAATGGDAAMVARHVAAAVGLGGAGAATGIAVHLALSLALGIALAGLMRPVQRLVASDGAMFALMPGALAVVWAVNFFVMLPVISPSFVHLLPLTVSLASKLAFGFAAGVTWRILAAPSDHTTMHMAPDLRQAPAGSVAQ